MGFLSGSWARVGAPGASGTRSPARGSSVGPHLQLSRETLLPGGHLKTGAGGAGRKASLPARFALGVCFVSCTFCYGVLGQETQMTLPEKGNIAWMWGGHPDPAVAVGSRPSFTSLFMAAPSLAREPIFSSWLFLKVALSVVSPRLASGTSALGGRLERSVRPAAPERGGCRGGTQPRSRSSPGLVLFRATFPRVPAACGDPWRHSN